MERQIVRRSSPVLVESPNSVMRLQMLIMCSIRSEEFPQICSLPWCSRTLSARLDARWLGTRHSRSLEATLHFMEKLHLCVFQLTKYLILGIICNSWQWCERAYRLCTPQQARQQQLRLWATWIYTHRPARSYLETRLAIWSKVLSVRLMCTCLHARIRVCVFVCVCVRACVYVGMYVGVSVCLHTCVCVCACVLGCLHSRMSGVCCLYVHADTDELVPNLAVTVLRV